MNTIHITNVDTEQAIEKQIDVIYKVDSLSAEQDNITIYDIERINQLAEKKGFSSQLPHTTTMISLKKLAQDAGCKMFFNEEEFAVEVIVPKFKLELPTGEFDITGTKAGDYEEGSDISITVSPKEGFEIVSITESSNKLNIKDNKITGKMPNQDVSITIETKSAE